MNLPVSDLVNRTIALRCEKMSIELRDQNAREKDLEITALSKRGMMTSPIGLTAETRLDLKFHKEHMLAELRIVIEVLADSSIPLTDEIADALGNYFENRNEGFKRHIPSNIDGQLKRKGLQNEDGERWAGRAMALADRVLGDVKRDLEIALNTSRLRQGAREIAAYGTIRDLELALRQFVSCHLSIVSADWVKQRVSDTVCKRWESRLKDRNGKSYSWLDANAVHMDMADFTDYAAMIEQGNNWSEVFQLLLGKKEELIPKLHELQALRNEIAHMRPLSDQAHRALEQLCADVAARLRRGMASASSADEESSMPGDGGGR